MKPKIILASKSPRRQELIKGLELPYEICTFDADESFPAGLKAHEIAVYLAEKKAAAFPGKLEKNEILLTADTIVWINGQVLNKPESREDSFRMLSMICGTKHSVYTGVCLQSLDHKEVFFEHSEVHCLQLTEEEILHYIDHYKPYDKAGSYGIQDWFGYTAVHQINGCFYNVMGLPVSRVYRVLKGFGGSGKE